jgi:hypothetical protein
MNDITKPTDQSAGANRFARVGDDVLTLVWRMQKHIMFNWEIDTEALEPFVPKELTLVEVRPGISLLSIAGMLYAGGHFGKDSPPFFELAAIAHVQSDLSHKMPMSRFAAYSISVYSNSLEFVKQESEVTFTPAFHDPTLELTFTENWDGIDARDKDGPIVSLRNTHPNPVYKADEMWGQHYNDTKGLQFGVWQWDGSKFEHMHKGDAGRFHLHPFFKGIDISRIRGCYRQLIPKPGAPLCERFYTMHQLRA